MTQETDQPSENSNPLIKEWSQSPFLRGVNRVVEILVVLAIIVIIASLLLPPVEQSRSGARKTQLRYQMEQIWKALSQYEAEHGHLPDTAIRNEQGEPLLSWRVRLLPYLGEQELYEQFDLTSAWDSEQNRKLLERIPDLFHNRIKQVLPYHTNLLLASSIDLPENQSALFAQGDGRRFEEISDGGDQTILLVTVNSELNAPWTQPVDYQFDPEHPKAGLGHDHLHGFMVLLADGNVRYFLPEASDEEIRSLFTYRGGDSQK